MTRCSDLTIHTIQVGNETPLMTRWFRLKHWRNHQPRNLPLEIREQPFAVDNNKMFSNFFDEQPRARILLI